jgi:hypothetical protein
MSGKPLRSVTVRYRALGGAEWREAPMGPVFRRTYAGSIPAEAVTFEGVEFFVRAEDEIGRKACAPRGAPDAAWSVTVR